jgi:4-oxalocrotonate tautomerase
MPIIQVNVAEGRTVEQKLAAFAAITDAVVRTLDVRPEQVRILINEVSPENFAIAGETMAARAARESARESAIPEKGS